MKRKITAVISVIFALLMMLSVTVPAFAADGKLLYTDVDAFTADEQEEISGYLAEKSQEIDCDLVCICLSSFKTYENGKYTQETIGDIAKDYYEANKIGRGEDGDAVIAVWVDDAEPKVEGFKVSVFGKKYTEDDVLYTYYELLNEYFDDRLGSENSDYYLRCKAFADGFETVASGEEYVTKVDDNGDTVIYRKDEYKYNQQKDTLNVLKYIGIAVLIGAVIGFIIATILKSGLKSVKKQSGASNYVVEDSFKLDNKNDVFLYKKVDKTPKPKPQEPAKK